MTSRAETERNLIAALEITPSSSSAGKRKDAVEVDTVVGIRLGADTKSSSIGDTRSRGAGASAIGSIVDDGIGEAGALSQTRSDGSRALGRGLDSSVCKGVGESTDSELEVGVDLDGLWSCQSDGHVRSVVAPHTSKLAVPQIPPVPATFSLAAAVTSCEIWGALLEHAQDVTVGKVWPPRKNAYWNPRCWQAV